MEALVNAFLAIGLLVVIILIVYLVDRVNSIERETRRVAQTLATPAAAVPQGPFFGLSGKPLWDTLSGRGALDLSPQALAELRENYEVVLQKHIQALFDEGFQDGKRGLSADPKNIRKISTAKGNVESWLPGPLANTLYKCGLDCAQLPAQEWGPVQTALDEAGQQLFARVDIPLLEPLSLSLMPGAEPLALPSEPASNKPSA